MPPLLQRLTERKPESLDYLGVSYGLTPQLLRQVVCFLLDTSSLVDEKTLVKILETSRICASIYPTDDERVDRRTYLRDGQRVKYLC